MCLKYSEVLTSSEISYYKCYKLMWTPTIQFSIKTKKIRKIKIKTKSGDHWLYKHGAQWILEGCGLGTSGEGIGLFGLVLGTYSIAWKAL